MEILGWSSQGGDAGMLRLQHPGGLQPGMLPVLMGECLPKWGCHRHGAEPDASASPSSISGCFFLPPHSKILVVPLEMGIPIARTDSPQLAQMGGNKQHFISRPDPGGAGGQWGGPGTPSREERGTCHGEASQLITVQGNGSRHFFPTASKADVPGDYGGFAPQMSPQHSSGCSHPPPPSTLTPSSLLGS